MWVCFSTPYSSISLSLYMNIIVPFTVVLYCLYYADSGSPLKVPL